MFNFWVGYLMGSAQDRGDSMPSEPMSARQMAIVAAIILIVISSLLMFFQMFMVSLEVTSCGNTIIDVFCKAQEWFLDEFKWFLMIVGALLGLLVGGFAAYKALA